MNFVTQTDLCYQQTLIYIHWVPSVSWIRITSALVTSVVYHSLLFLEGFFNVYITSGRTLAILRFFLIVLHYLNIIMMFLISLKKCWTRMCASRWQYLHLSSTHRTIIHEYSPLNACIYQFIYLSNSQKLGGPWHHMHADTSPTTDTLLVTLNTKN